MLAPCNCPCSLSPTRRVISDCKVGMANPHRALGSMAMMKATPVGAQPIMAMPRVPPQRPRIIVIRSPIFLEIGPTRTP
ncbi:hypothetical protein D3C86_1551650 [compost metagenome]